MVAALILDVVTLFPRMFEGPLSESLLGRAEEAGRIQVRVHNLRQWSDDPRHSKVDDRPYGGGAGMVIRAEPIYRALKALKATGKTRSKPWVVYLSPQGKPLNQVRCQELAKKKRIVLICGHYEGIDERAAALMDEEISIGDYVLTGGEIPALVVIDAVARLVPGVVGDPASIAEESFSNGRLDFPSYTRPPLWRGKRVPEVLLSGDHKKIKKWRDAEASRRTREKRPDLTRKTG
jgi:tRNA (guanine37-N1)-methyltransferase